MRDPSDIQQLVDQAVRLLAIGKHEIKHRLLCAYTQKLQYVFPEDVPPDLSPLLVSIRKRLFKEPRYDGQSTVESALYRMHGRTAAAIASDVYELQRALRERSKVNEEKFLRGLAVEAEATVHLLSAPGKCEKERRTCAAFLRCAGVPFSASDLKCSKDEPPDVCFERAAFEVKMLLAGRQIDREWKAIAKKRRNAQCIDEVLESADQPQPFSFADLLQMVVDALNPNKVKYDPQTRGALDILLYVNVKGRFLYDQSPLPHTTTIDQMGFRSVSVVLPPYAWVVAARASAPAFLRERIGIIQHCCEDPGAYFEL